MHLSLPRKKVDDKETSTRIRVRRALAAGKHRRKSRKGQAVLSYKLSNTGRVHLQPCTDWCGDIKKNEGNLYMNGGLHPRSRTTTTLISSWAARLCLPGGICVKYWTPNLQFRFQKKGQCEIGGIAHIYEAGR